MARLLSGIQSGARFGFLFVFFVLTGLGVQTASAAGECTALTFDPPVDYSVGELPQLPATGDLDGDGDSDLVIPNYDSGDLTVLLSTDGVFAPASGSPIALPGPPWFARVGNFIGDGDADVAVAVNHSVIVFEGKGDGTFEALTATTDVTPSLTSSGGALTVGFSFAAADLDDDTILDLALAATNAQKAAVWLGSGDGTFTFSEEWDIGTWPAPVAVADLDGDSLPDFAVGDSWNDTSASGSLVYVFLQVADGLFADPVSYEAYKSVRGLALADLDGDGYPEIVAPNYYGHGYQAYGDDAGRVTVLFGNAAGTFDSPSHPLTGASNPDSVVVADFDGDGELDVVTSNQWTPPAISVLRGDGLGSFAAPDLYTTSVGDYPTFIASGDFNADGLPDLVWDPNYQNWSDGIKVMLNASIVDSTPPVITPTVTGTLGGAGWYVSDVDVEWAVSDDECVVESSTGCDAASVATDTAGVLFTCSATSDGGTSEESVTIKRDATPPSAVASAGPPPNSYGWRRQNVSVTFSGSDATSGGVTCDPQIVLSAEGYGQSASGNCYDAAGNESNLATASGINIDKTNPTAVITYPVDGATYSRNAVVNASFTCDDLLSGIASCVGTLGAGQPINTSKKVKNAKFTVTATDRAGNLKKATVTYSVN